MAIRRVEYVDQPLVMRRYTPDTRALQVIFGDTGSRLAAIDLKKGENTNDLMGRLGAIFSGYQDIKRQQKQRAEDIATRAAERADEMKLRRDQMEQDRLEREATNARLLRGETRAAAQDVVENVPAGPIDPGSASTLRAYPGTAGLVTDQQTLPATALPGTAPVDPTPRPFAVRGMTPKEIWQAQKDFEAKTQAENLERERKLDRERQDKALAFQVTNGEAMRKIAQQNADTARQNADTTQKRYTSTGLDTSNLQPEYADALDSALMTFPATRRGPVVRQANAAAATGDGERVAEIIKEAALAGENVDARNQINGRRATIAALEDAKKMLAELKAAGVPTNWLTGTAEDLARRFGDTTDPKLVALKTRLMDAVVQYRRAATGVAFSERESQDYARMFPNYSQTLPVNEAVIEGLSRSMKSNDRAYWEGKLGKKGAKLVLGGDAPAPAEGAGGGGKEPGRVYYDQNGKVITKP